MTEDFVKEEEMNDTIDTIKRAHKTGDVRALERLFWPLGAVVIDMGPRYAVETVGVLLWRRVISWSEPEKAMALYRDLCERRKQ